MRGLIRFVVPAPLFTSVGHFSCRPICLSGYAFMHQSIHPPTTNAHHPCMIAPWRARAHTHTHTRRAHTHTRMHESGATGLGASREQTTLSGQSHRGCAHVLCRHWPSPLLAQSHTESSGDKGVGWCGSGPDVMCTHYTYTLHPFRSDSLSKYVENRDVSKSILCKQI